MRSPGSLLNCNLGGKSPKHVKAEKDAREHHTACTHVARTSELPHAPRTPRSLAEWSTPDFSRLPSARRGGKWRLVRSAGGQTKAAQQRGVSQSIHARMLHTYIHLQPRLSLSEQLPTAGFFRYGNVGVHMYG